HQYAGGYSDMVAQKGSGVGKRKSEKPAAHEQSKSAGEKPVAPSTPAPQAPGKVKLSFKQKHALETLPKEIAKLEEEVIKLKKALEAPELYSKEPAKFQKFAKALEERETLLGAKEEEWLELEMLKEEMGI
ncbi:MAG: ABC transporter ATP-binding protein, partial [Salaquimonas sp.]